jgi:hypothetical protein
MELVDSSYFTLRMTIEDTNNSGSISYVVMCSLLAVHFVLSFLVRRYLDSHIFAFLSG